ncbi:nucleotidyltransferase family protein [Chloracidobacterium thermophilum]|uniref:nucleotidyltransferase family protein n=1 Tax=Chloracidobacterium thermophilum TaxID=458033 RepID=UPI000738CD6F|nr:nucleotidyltransferase family protein [Chloracidobacterium thermophilum]
MPHLSDIPLQTIEEFCRKHHIRQLSLFGSAARGDFRPESDVDILVEFQADARVGFLQLSRMQRELTEIFHRPVDLVPRTGLKPAIREQVLKEEIVLYAA